MSLRINLLPEYVQLQRTFKRITTICVAVFAVVATVLFLVYYKRQQDLATLQTDLQNIEVVAKQSEAAAAAADAAKKESQPKRGAIDFAVAASRTGPERAALLDLISSYVYGGAVVTSLDVSDGQNVKIRATVRNPDEYARLLNNLRRGSDVKGGPVFQGLPGGSGVPGFPPPQPGEAGAEGNQNVQPGQQPAPVTVSQPSILVYPVVVDLVAVLKNPVQLPADPVGAPAPAEGEPGAPPGQPVPPAPPAPAAP